MTSAKLIMTDYAGDLVQTTSEDIEEVLNYCIILCQIIIITRWNKQYTPYYLHK